MKRFDRNRVAALLLPGEITWSLQYEPACDSTQDRARAAALEGVTQGWTVITDLQRAGRGRLGRSWVAPDGDALLVSLVLYPPIDVMAKLPLLAALAVAGGIEATTGVGADLKWPNDVLVNGQKIAGILIERPAGSAAIVGIGVNVNQPAADLPDGATSLATLLGRAVERERLLAAILNDLSNAYERADREGVQWIVPGWRTRSSMLGQPIRFIRDGQPVDAVALDVTEEGALRVRTADWQELDLVAGEVESIRRA